MQHPGYQGGLIGGLMVVADLTSKSNDFNDAAKGKRPDLENIMKRKLSQCNNPDVREYFFMKQELVREENKFLNDYTKLGTENDAYLDIRFIRIGYEAELPTSNYYPSVVTKVQLVDARNNKILYAATISYGDPWRQSDTLIQVPLTGTHAYKNMNDLITNIGPALEGLSVGIEQIANRICNDLQ